jgi:hypothetical protein
MARVKITDLGAGTATSGDEVPANRAGADAKLLVQDIAALFTTSAGDAAEGKIEIAIQSEMETGTSATLAITPGRQHFHPSACKFWVYWTGGSTTILADFNVDSIANTTTGDADITITTGFSDANWAGLVCSNDSSTDGWDANSIQSCGFNARAAGTAGVLCGFIIDGNTAAATLNDPDQWQAAGFGDHA